jgi:hypothetical protein
MELTEQKKSWILASSYFLLLENNICNAFWVPLCIKPVPGHGLFCGQCGGLKSGTWKCGMGKWNTQTRAGTQKSTKTNSHLFHSFPIVFHFLNLKLH